MLTIDRLAKIDSIALRSMATIYRGLERVGDKFETQIVNAAYKVVEAKAAAIGKVEDKISDLEDEQAEAAAKYIEAKDKLRADFLRLAASLDKAQAKTEADIQDKLASAALELVAAEKAYEATVKAASDKLAIEVRA